MLCTYGGTVSRLRAFSLCYFNHIVEIQVRHHPSPRVVVLNPYQYQDSEDELNELLIEAMKTVSDEIEVWEGTLQNTHNLGLG